MTDLLREQFEKLPFVSGCFQIGKVEYKNYGGYYIDGEPYLWLNGAWQMFKHVSIALEQANCNHTWCGKSENQYCGKCGKQG